MVMGPNDKVKGAVTRRVRLPGVHGYSRYQGNSAARNWRPCFSIWRFMASTFAAQHVGSTLMHGCQLKTVHCKLLSPWRPERLRPVHTHVAATIDRVSGAHFGKGRIHQVGAMPRAFDPARDRLFGFHL